LQTPCQVANRQKGLKNSEKSPFFELKFAKSAVKLTATAKAHYQAPEPNTLKEQFAKSSVTLLWKDVPDIVFEITASL